MSPLSQFKAQLIPGATLEVTFESFTIRGNTSTTVIPAKTETRKVLRVTSSRAYLLKPDGKESIFDFSASNDLTFENNAYIYSEDGQKILSYRFI